MSRILLKATIQLGRVQRPAGSELDLDDAAEVQRLVAAGDAEAVIPAEPVLSEEEQFYVSLVAKDAIDYIGTVESLTVLSALARIEESRKGGARKTVTEAFAVRGAALQAAGPET